ncbi:MAG: iron-containing alcohol dehydrogenase [Sphingomonadales bacterium]
MSTFHYTTPPSLIFGRGTVKNIGQVLKQRFNATRFLVVSDQGLQKNGLTAGVLKSLGKAGLDYQVFDAISSDPLEEEVQNGTRIARDYGAEGIIGFGGGSPMDAAKAIAILAGTGRPIADLYGQDKVTGNRLPLILIPTTAGTGSEVTPYAVITAPNGDKISITGQQSVPDAAFLDAELTLGLPLHLTAACGIDAMVHAIEAFTSKGNKTHETDLAAKQALKLLWAALPRALRERNDIEARENMLIGAMLAGKAISNAPVGGIHALAYPLGGLHHIHHGLSNALLLPPVLRFNAKAAAPQYGELADLVMPGISGGADEKTAAFIDALEVMIAGSGLETRLSRVGISHNHIPGLAIEAMKLDRLLKNNPRKIILKDSLEIYESIL